MNLARVKGSVWMNRQHPAYAGRKLLVVQPETPEGLPKGPEVLAVDDVDAGVGDRILLMEEGNGARQILADANAPIRSIVVGVVDGTDLGSR